MGHRSFRLHVQGRPRSVLRRVARQGRRVPGRAEARGRRQPVVLCRGTRRGQHRLDGVLMAMTEVDVPEVDIIVVGAGNAATCAALSAAENGASVLMLEVAPQHWRGGNSAFTGGA